MSIEGIRAEIPKAFNGDIFGVEKWLVKHGGTDYINTIPDPDFNEPEREAALKLVDWAYEAGISESGKKLYEKGYETGKAEGHTCDEGCCESKWELGFEAAAEDPKAWYVLDKNGEKVHIGDTVKNRHDVKEITGLGNNELFAPWWSGSPASSFEKIIPDTREKIIEELADWGYNSDCEESRKIAEKFVSRIEALGAR